MFEFPAAFTRPKAVKSIPFALLSISNFVLPEKTLLKKPCFALFIFLPCLLDAQSKRKLRLAAEKEKAVIVSNLKKHIQYLASDQLEGRRTGSKGELLAMEYIVDQYKQMGLTPKGNNGFVQESYYKYFDY